MAGKYLSAYALSLLVIPGIVYAAPADSGGPSYNNIGLQYINTDLDGLSADGLSISLSKAPSEHVFFDGRFGLSETERTEVGGEQGTIRIREARLRVGWRLPISDSADLNISTGFISTQRGGTDGLSVRDQDSTGGILSAGFRASASPSLEFLAETSYVDGLDDPYAVVRVSGVKYVTPSLGLQIEYLTNDDDSSRYMVGLRYTYH